jgi:plastocyanin
MSARITLLLAATLAFAPALRAENWFVIVGGSELVFSPQTLTVTAGDTVTFINLGGYHNVVADDGSFRCARGCDDDGQGGNGNSDNGFWSVRLSFPAPGTVGYFCELHGSPGEGMYGTIVVEQQAAISVAVSPLAPWLPGLLLAPAVLVLASRRLGSRTTRGS